jgi:hypothetical protein
MTMITRFIIAGATIVALGAPAVQAAPACPIFLSFFSKVQCSFQETTGNGNSALIKQDQRGFNRGLQLAIQIQHGDNNVAYTGQKGTNDVALTVQNGDNNTAGTHQEGTNLAAVTVQTGNNGWSTIGQSGNGGTAAVVQDN